MEDPGFFPIRKLAIVGLGLIGGSLAIDLRRLGLAAEILGYDSNPEHCTKAKELHLADHCNSVPDETLRDADWIMFAVPVQSTEKALEQFRPFLKPDILITDTGSVKAPLQEIMLRSENAGYAFVGGHPIAGGERFGPEAAIEASDLRSCLTEHGIVRRQAEITEQMQHLTTPDGVTSHECDHPRGKAAEYALQIQHIQPRQAVLSHVAAIATHALIAD